eukprot:Opistho-2@38527
MEVLMGTDGGLQLFSWSGSEAAAEVLKGEFTTCVMSLPPGVGRVGAVAVDRLHIPQTATEAGDYFRVACATEAPQGSIASGASDLFETAFAASTSSFSFSSSNGTVCAPIAEIAQVEGGEVAVDVRGVGSSVGGRSSAVMSVGRSAMFTAFGGGRDASSLVLQRKDFTPASASVFIVRVTRANGNRSMALQAEAALAGVLAPDLAVLDGESLFVGSNTVRGIHHFDAVEGSLKFNRLLSLGQSSRPKGLAVWKCGLSRLLVAIACDKKESGRPALVSIRTLDDFDAQIIAIADISGAVAGGRTGDSADKTRAPMQTGAFSGANSAYSARSTEGRVALGNDGEDSEGGEEIPASLLAGRLLLPSSGGGGGNKGHSWNRLVFEVKSDSPEDDDIANSPVRGVGALKNEGGDGGRITAMSGDDRLLRALELFSARMDAQFVRVFGVLDIHSQRLSAIENALGINNSTD